jgi:hypothetical protein
VFCDTEAVDSLSEDADAAMVNGFGKDTEEDWKRLMKKTGVEVA